MTDEVFFNKMVTKGLEPIESDGRFFEGYLTVEVKDKQGEVTIVDELYKVLPIWMDRGAPITDTHSNRVIGKGINFARAVYTDADGETYPAIKVTGKIYKDYELDNEIWAKIKSGEYKGLSFGGSTKTDREPMRMKDGSIAYSLSKLEHYEVAVCKDPAVPLAVITDINPIAKANMNCDHTGCYVTKPILGEPDFESATRKVMEESNVPEKNAKRIVGAAEHGKLRKGIIAIGNKEKCPFCDDIQGTHFDDATDHLTGKHMKEFMAALSGDENIGVGESKEKAVICKDCGLPKKLEHAKEDIDEHIKIMNSKKTSICKDCQLSHEGSCIDAWKKGKKKKPSLKKYWERDTECPTCKQIRPDHRYRCPHCGAMGYDKKKPKETKCPHCGEDINKGKQVKERKKRKKQSQGVGNKRSWRAFKSLVDTNKILNLYQGNILPLARILDKDAPADIKRPTGNVPAKRKEPKGQSHGAQSTRERERGIKEQQDSPDYHYTKPQSLDPKRVTVPNEEFGEGFGDTYPFSTLEDKLDYQRARRPYESLIGTDATLADPRKRKSLFATIYNKLKGKKKVKKVGSGAMIDPNQANQGAGFAIRNQTPPRRKKVRTMQAKLGDGTYDYSS